MSQPGSALLVARDAGTATGTSRYAASLAAELAGLGWRVRLRRPRPPWPRPVDRLIARLGVDAAAFWSSYPLAVGRAGGDLLHLTSQTLATAIALGPRPGPVVVTVHDILPHTLRHDPELATLRHPVDAAFYRLALRGIGRADLVLADSRYTADQLSRTVGLPDERLRVVPLGVDAARFRPAGLDDAARRQLGLDARHRYAIYVGSEDPRKNLPALFEAFAAVAPRHPDLRLLKVGPAHHHDQRARLLALAARLGIAERVTYVDYAPEELLPRLYGQAELCVVPSTHEGFGLPVLEAMACGVPVVCANRTSLPEVAGPDALVVEPTPAGLADGVERLLADPDLRRDLRERGLRRAAAFTWRRTAELTAAAYAALRDRRYRKS